MGHHLHMIGGHGQSWAVWNIKNARTTTRTTRTSVIVQTMKVWVQSFGTQLVHLLDVVVQYVVDKLFVVGFGIHRLQLFLVHLEHLVHSTLVLHLEEEKKEHCRHCHDDHSLVSFYVMMLNQ